MGHEFSCFQRTVKWPRTFYFVTFNWTSTYSLVFTTEEFKKWKYKKKKTALNDNRNLPFISSNSYRIILKS